MVRPCPTCDRIVAVAHREGLGGIPCDGGGELIFARVGQYDRVVSSERVVELRSSVGGGNLQRCEIIEIDVVCAIREQSGGQLNIGSAGAVAGESEGVAGVVSRQLLCIGLTALRDRQYISRRIQSRRSATDIRKIRDVDRAATVQRRVDGSASGVDDLDAAAADDRTAGNAAVDTNVTAAADNRAAGNAAVDKNVTAAADNRTAGNAAVVDKNVTAAADNRAAGNALTIVPLTRSPPIRTPPPLLTTVPLATPPSIKTKPPLTTVPLAMPPGKTNSSPPL